MPEALPDPNRIPRFSWVRLARSSWVGACLVAVASTVVFAYDLPSEPHFADESAYVTQSYYWRTFAEGRRDDPSWLEFPAYDLPPLPKYLIGASYAFHGFRTPGRVDASDWYADINRRFETAASLTAARWPSVFLGALGCTALYGLGVLLSGRAVGLLAALLLTVNPLYHTHARRAMSDVPCESFMLLGLFCALWAWQRFLSGRPVLAAWVVTALAGASAGLAVLCKLSGTLALMVMAVWVALGWAVPARRSRKLTWTFAAGFAALTAGAVFIGLDPYLTAHPRTALPPRSEAVNHLSLWERARMLAVVRVDTADAQKRLFIEDALHTPYDKVSTTAVQGFGRFGPFGPRVDNSEVRYELAQDWGAFLWLPWVCAGAVWAGFLGWCQFRKGEVPVAWALLDWFLVVLTVVTAYLPMAWNRYFLPIQAPAALLASGVAVAALSRVWDRVRDRKARA